MKKNRRVLLTSAALIAAVAIGAVLLHSPEFHEHMTRLHGGVHDRAGGPAAALIGEAGGSPAANARAREGVAAIGKRWDAAAFAQTVALYTAVHREIDWPGILEPKTVRYGPDGEHTFDFFLPEQRFSEPGPVFVFLPGNGLGDTARIATGSDGLIYGHLGKLAATAGGIGVSMNIHSGAQAAVPAVAGSNATLEAAAEDLGLVIEWIVANIASYGGDPETIVVLGNAEGATATAAYLFNEDWQPRSGPNVAAAILSSGDFGAQVSFIEQLVSSYDGERVPLSLWSGEYDTVAVTDGLKALHEQLCAKYEGCPGYEQIPGHNRVSHIMSLGTADTEAMNRFIRFYHTVR
jgi:triacylglycerol lipase